MKRKIRLLKVLITSIIILLLIILIPIISLFSGNMLNKQHDCSGARSGRITGGHMFDRDYVVLQGFGFNSWSTGAGAWLYAGTGVGHTGIDVQPLGVRDFYSEDISVYTISDGEVLSVGSSPIGGNYVKITMEDGKYAYYGHLKSYNVKIGDKVKQGDKIGILGRTGATDVFHVHFEVSDNPTQLSTKDSSRYLGKEKVNSGDIFRVGENSNIEINTTVSCSADSDGNLVGNDNIEKAWNFYKNKGFSDEAVAGILGNYMQESRMEPSLVEAGNGIGYGLAQWSFTRRTDLERWAKENNLDVSELSTQLKFSMVELDKMSFTENYKKMKDVIEATKVFHDEYEKAGIIHMANRYRFAEEIYRKYKGKR